MAQGEERRERQDKSRDKDDKDKERKDGGKIPVKRGVKNRNDRVQMHDRTIKQGCR